MAIFRSKILALHLDKERFVWVWGYVRHAVKLSTPMAIQSILMSGAQIVSTLIVAPLGSVAIATNSLAITAESLCYMPGHGIAEAATTLVGQSKGAEKRDLMHSFAWICMALGVGIMAIMGLIMWLFAPEMMSLINSLQETNSKSATTAQIIIPVINLFFTLRLLPAEHGSSWLAQTGYGLFLCKINSYRRRNQNFDNISTGGKWQFA